MQGHKAGQGDQPKIRMFCKVCLRQWQAQVRHTKMSHLQTISSVSVCVCVCVRVCVCGGGAQMHRKGGLTLILK